MGAEVVVKVFWLCEVRLAAADLDKFERLGGGHCCCDGHGCCQYEAEEVGCDHVDRGDMNFGKDCHKSWTDLLCKYTCRQADGISVTMLAFRVVVGNIHGGAGASGGCGGACQP